MRCVWEGFSQDVEITGKLRVKRIEHEPTHEFRLSRDEKDYYEESCYDKSSLFLSRAHVRSR